MKRSNLAAQAPQLENADGIAGTGFDFVLLWRENEFRMTEEADMSTLADDINKQINAGRKSMERSLDDLTDMEMPKLPPAGLVAAELETAVVAVGIVGWLVYRSRRRRTIMQRLQDALPDSVRDLPQGVRAQVKRAL